MYVHKGMHLFHANSVVFLVAIIVVVTLEVVIAVAVVVVVYICEHSRIVNFYFRCIFSILFIQHFPILFKKKRRKKMKMFFLFILSFRFYIFSLFFFLLVCHFYAIIIWEYKPLTD